MRNDDGGAAPTRKGTNWVVHGSEAVALGDGDRSDCSSRNVCGNASSSSLLEQPVGALALNSVTGSHRLEKGQ